jgi:hypothetical protein
MTLPGIVHLEIRYTAYDCIPGNPWEAFERCAPSSSPFFSVRKEVVLSVYRSTPYFDDGIHAALRACAAPLAVDFHARVDVDRCSRPISVARDLGRLAKPHEHHGNCCKLARDGHHLPRSRRLCICGGEGAARGVEAHLVGRSRRAVFLALRVCTHCILRMFTTPQTQHLHAGPPRRSLALFEISR